MTEAQKKQARSEARRAARLLRVFGLTVEEYEKILEHQGGVCAICEKPPKRKRLSVDHQHSSGQVRGALCARCNRGLALFGDSRRKLRRAREYLGNHPAVAALGNPRWGLKGRTSNKASTIRKLNGRLSARERT